MLIGFVGKPSAGKSTFFKAATLADVEIANYPFTTIKPNHGAGFVKMECADRAFNTQCHPRMGYCLDHYRFIPVDLMDVAGLVPGAHLGLGRGNQFLDDLRQADVLIHVIDISGSVNEKGEPVEALSYDPALDVRFLEEELDYWYLGILKKGWDKFARQLEQEKGPVHRALGKQLSGLNVTENMVKDVIEKLKLPEVPTNWTEEHLMQLSTELRKRTKPMVIACNKIDIDGAVKNYERLKSLFPDHHFFACSAESELALRQASKHGLIHYMPGTNTFSYGDEAKLNPAQKNALEFIKKNMLGRFGSTGVQPVLDAAVFSLLGCVAIFPGGVNKLADKEGNVLPDCFILPRNSTALDFAFRLHTDFGKNFIRAIDVKTKKAVGKDHMLKNGDVVEIVAGR